MAASESASMIDVKNVDIANMNVAVPEKSRAIQAWIAMTPVLSILIAALTLFSTMFIQIYQSHAASAQKEDSDWRTALEQISTDEKSAAIGTFEMQSFLDAEKHKDQARSIAAALMPNITDKYEFDAAFFVLLKGTKPNNQTDITGIARTVSNELRGLYQRSLELNGCDHPRDCSFAAFTAQPDRFFLEQTQSDLLAQTLTDLWKLDSVSSGLMTIWSHKFNGVSLQPGKLDLAGIIFLSNDFRGIDFRDASMDHAEFVGNCHVDANRLPQGVQIFCGK
jgi:hypothetical protein